MSMLPLWPRPVWAEIDLNSFAFNIEQIHLKFPDKKILVAVKANAYGHGLVGISRYAEQNLPVDYLAVALIGEGITLRQAGIRMPILVFGGLLPEDIPYLFEYDLIPSIINPEIARRIDFYAQEHNRRIKAHLVVDTGMGRIGFYYQQAIEELLSMQALSHIEWEGIYTHFPSADEKDKCFTLEQIARLRRIIDDLAGRGFTFPLRHSFNSGAIIDLEDDYFNLVRPGVMAYGLYPSPEVDLSFPLKQVMTLKGRIVFLKEVEPGRTISYGRSWAPKERTIIATVPLGYGDGINRRFSKGGNGFLSWDE